MNRRDFLGRAGIGATMLPISAFASIRPDARSAYAQHDTTSGPLATATMSFGAWRTDGDPAQTGTATPNRVRTSTGIR